MGKKDKKKEGNKVFKVKALESLFEEATEYARVNLEMDQGVIVETPFGLVTVTKVTCPLPKAEFSINWQIGVLWATRQIIKFLSAFHAKQAEGKESKIRVPKINPAMEKWLLNNPEFVKAGMGKAIEIAADTLINQNKEKENSEMGKKTDDAETGKKKDKEKAKKSKTAALTEEQLAAKIKLKTCKKDLEKIFEDDAEKIIESAFGEEKKTKLSKLVKAIEKAGFETNDEKLVAKLAGFIETAE